MEDETPKLPGIVEQTKNFAMSYIKWVKAGRPLRLAEEIEKLFDDHCVQCPVKQFIKIDDTTGRCASCGCWIRRDTKGLNKLKWPTEGCPHGVFSAEVEPEE